MQHSVKTIVFSCMLFISLCILGSCSTNSEAETTDTLTLSNTTWMSSTNNTSLNFDFSDQTYTYQAGLTSVSSGTYTYDTATKTITLKNITPSTAKISSDGDSFVFNSLTYLRY